MVVPSDKQCCMLLSPGHLARGHHAGAYSGMRQHPNAAGGSRPSSSNNVLQPVRNQQQVRANMAACVKQHAMHAAWEGWMHVCQ
jgi:hypothetical protein